MRQNSVLDTLVEAARDGLEFIEVKDSRDVPADVVGAVESWLNAREVKPEHCIEIWRATFGRQVKRSFYIYRFYISSEYATSISLLIKGDLIVGESHQMME